MNPSEKFECEFPSNTENVDFESDHADSEDLIDQLLLKPKKTTSKQSKQASVSQIFKITQKFKN